MLKKILVVLGILLALAVFLVARDWDSSEPGQKVLDKVGDATGARVTATGFHLNLLHGLVLENVHASSEKEGRELTVSLDRLVFEHRLPPLLSGTVAIDRVVLERPQIELLEWDSGETEEAGKEPKEEDAPRETSAPRRPGRRAHSRRSGDPRHRRRLRPSPQGPGRRD